MDNKFLIRRRSSASQENVIRDEIREDEMDIEDEGDEDRDEPNFIPENTTPKSAKDPDFDIFSDLNPSILEKRGKNPAYYMIYRNSRQEFVAERHHPYSWSKLQDDFGAGFYIVIAREKGTQKILSTQSKQIGEPLSKDSGEDDMNSADLLKIVEQRLSSLQVPQTSQPNITELLTLVFTLQEKAKASAQPPPSNDALVQSIIGLVQSQSEKTAQSVSEQTKFMLEMNMRMQEQTSSMIKALNDSNAKMFEKFNEKIERLREEPKGNTGGGLQYSPEQIMKMQMDAQQLGFQMWQNLESMAEAKASQRLSVIESVRDKEIEEARPKSLGEKMFDALTPALATLVTKNMSMGLPFNAPAPTPIPQRPAKKPTPKKLPQKSTVQAVKVEVDEGLPKATPAPSQTQEVSPLEDPKFTSYLETLQPVLVDAWTNGQTVEQTGVVLLNCLQDKGITPQDFLTVVTPDKVETVLKPFGLQPEVFDWMRKLYDHISSETAMEDGGERSSTVTEL